MKLWQVEINIYDYEFCEVVFLFFRTKEDALKSIKEYDKKYKDVSTEIYGPKEVDFKDVKYIMSIKQFEELFNVDIESLLEDK